MRWYIAREGRTEGPFEGAEVAALAAAGKLVGTDLVQDETGDAAWTPAAKHPVIGVHLRSQSLPVPPSKIGRAGTPWLAIAAIAALLTFAAAGTLIFLHLRYHDALLARIDNATRHVDSVLAEMKEENAPAPFVVASQVHNNCTTDRTTVTCTFTNLQDRPVTTCNQGIVKQKEFPGVQLKSMIMCTGKLYPSESKVVTGSWVGGFADDICFRENGYGKSLDWGKCSFDTDDVDLPTLRKMNAVASK